MPHAWVCGCVRFPSARSFVGFAKKKSKPAAAAAPTSSTQSAAQLAAQYQPPVW